MLDEKVHKKRSENYLDNDECHYNDLELLKVIVGVTMLHLMIMIFINQLAIDIYLIEFNSIQL